ncbi:MAG: hypothetical protein MUC48_01005 [Leptolyngbya sp. Prado105]|jgi:hypothetical protein|nr:hypothetical protein [Leptolyngbya sp. Prado105]
MLKTMINVTQYPILQAIEQILEQYPDHPYQQAFAHPARHQQLIAWVLNRVPNLFIVAEDTNAAIVHPNYAPYCHDQQSCLEYIIRQGIQEILSNDKTELAHEIPSAEDSDPSVSHWFG